jgi:alkanesulfonate monooxygenase SsuD/methylene tetrahydromethanopterin reductase-like flavin-dependent oxidoreductase (luciferase family)
MGYQAGDFGAFGIPPSQRVLQLEEGINIIRACWTQDTVCYDGKRFRLDSVAVYPKPLRLPHPPIWVGAMADASIRRAVQYGDAWLTGITQPLPNILRHTQIYKAYASELDQPARIILIGNASVAETRQQAEAEYGPKYWLPINTTGRVIPCRFGTTALKRNSPSGRWHPSASSWALLRMWWTSYNTGKRP